MKYLHPDSSLWYTIHTRSRFENVVLDQLTKKSFETFLPKMKKPSKRKDRRVVLDVPIFPGYLFVRTALKPDTHLSILKSTGVVRLVGSSTGPLPVDENALESLRIMVSAGHEIITGPTFTEGDLVIVTRGPFEGMTGVFQQDLGQGRVVVNMDLLGQSAAVHIDDTDLEPVIR